MTKLSTKSPAVDAFLKRLAETVGKEGHWEFKDHTYSLAPGLNEITQQCIRRSPPGQMRYFSCPISSVNNRHTGAYRNVGHDLGLTDDEINAIADAADDAPGHDPELRQRLLLAVGLIKPVEQSSTPGL